MGSKLRDIREESGMTRERVSERTEIGLRHLAAIELGEKNPSASTLSGWFAVLVLLQTEYFIRRSIRVTAIWTAYHGYPRPARQNRGR